MPKRDSAPVGAPCWVDLFTSDPDKSRAFYSAWFNHDRPPAGAMRRWSTRHAL
jgi:predicted enzyme related to lactoylglutathione lyase